MVHRVAQYQCIPDVPYHTSTKLVHTIGGMLHQYAKLTLIMGVLVLCQDITNMGSDTEIVNLDFNARQFVQLGI